MDRIPSTAITTNQRTITGPKSPPTRWVPYCWMTNKTIRITTDSGTSHGVKTGVATVSPSTALKMLIAA
jgi:hypothetical protein